MAVFWILSDVLKRDGSGHVGFIVDMPEYATVDSVSAVLNDGKLISCDHLSVEHAENASRVSRRVRISVGREHVARLSAYSLPIAA